LFVNGGGEYATFDISGDTLIGGGNLGNPGANWSFAGIGDLNGYRENSILFHNTSTGAYATWEMNDTTIVGGRNLGAFGAGFTLAAVT
jgi:hypothetical protein